MTPPSWLLKLGVPADCVSQSSSASENQRSFSIRPESGDVIWRVKIDDCWFSSSNLKKVDYLFWASSSSGRKLVLLVELKGKDFGTALQQIEASLHQLCKLADGQGIHTGDHRLSPGHDRHDQAGVRAYVILSKGKGVGVPQRQIERARLSKRYGVIVHPQSQRLEVKGVDALP